MSKGTVIQGGKFATLAAVTSFLHLEPELYDRDWSDVWYPVEWLPIAASAQGQTRSVQVDTQADFCAVGAVYTCSQDGAEGTFVNPAPITVSIAMPGNKSLIGQVGNNQGVTHINNVAGSGLGSLVRWPSNYLIPRGGTFTVTASNLVATAYSLRMAILGWYIY